MPVKIDCYTSFDNAFKQSGELVFEMAAELISRLTPTEVLDLLMAKVSVVAAKHDGDKVLILLQMVRKQLVTVCVQELKEKKFTYDSERDRAAEQEADIRYRTYLAELFWLLPDTRQETTYSAMDQDGSRYPDGHMTLQALPVAKHFIFRELLPEWTAEPTERSVHAFRRVIAMGWPLRESFTFPREGEQEAELKARGRMIDGKEQGKYADDVRQHMEYFGGYGDKDADKIFGPWLAQPNVPEAIEKLLTVARTKKGEADLARRDIRNAAILEGLPESGLAVLRAQADQMRVWHADAESVLASVVDAQRKRYPGWRANTLPHAFTFTSQTDLTIEFNRCQDDDDQSRMFGEAYDAIASAKAAGRFKGCPVRLAVKRSDAGTAILRHAWDR